MRLIDADALLEKLKDSRFPGAPYIDAGISIAIGKVLDAPTIEERKTGRWINVRDGNTADCDQCGSTGMAWMNFCPICGSDNREVEHE